MTIISGMKIIDVRRHSIAGHDGRLTEKGVELARFAGETLHRPCRRAYVSPKERARQTAELFGAPLPEVIEHLAPLSIANFPAYQERIEWFASKGLSLLESYFAVPAIMPLLIEHGKEVLKALADIACSLDEGGEALAVSHGGTIEPAALIALGGTFELETMGGELGNCEGVRFGYLNDVIVLVETVRLPSGRLHKT